MLSTLAVGWLTRLQFLLWAMMGFFSVQHIQTSSGVHQALYPVVPEALTLVVKWLGHEACHLPPSSAELMCGAIPPLPQCLVVN
jgi:hypothetical protein